MKYRVFFAVLVVFLCSCDEGREVGESFVAEKPISILKPEYAKGFQINYYLWGKEIVVFDLADSNQVLSRVRIGKSEKLNKDSLDRFACLSTTHLSYFQKLNALEKVVGVSHSSYILNEEIKTKVADASISEIASSGEVDAEILLGLEADVFFTYPFGELSFDKVQSLGIPCVPVSEYLEEHPLGRAEWLLFFAAFYGQEEYAIDVFKSIESQYNTIVQLNNMLIEKDGLKRPLVLAGSEENGKFYVPPGNTFISQIISDAGGKYMFEEKHASGNLTIEFEEMMAHADKIDSWGMITYDGGITPEELLQRDERYRFFRVLTEGGFFYCDSSTKDYFGEAVVEPHVVLLDLINVFYPHNDPSYLPKYFFPSR